MRFICLHGVGSSGSICETHFGPFLAAVDPSYEFVFVDGPAPSVRGPGMGAVEGPFYSHTEGYSPSQMSTALQHLDACIKEMGPFDGVVGFSQGAATAISYMYDQHTRYGRKPFKVALLFSSVCAFSPNPQYSRQIVEQLCARRQSFDDIVEVDDLPPDESALAQAFIKIIIPLKEGGALFPDIDMEIYNGGDAEVAPRLLVPSLMGEKLSIPTVHMHGKRDAPFMRSMSLVARDMFEKKLMKTLEHGGSHIPPQSDSEVRAAVRAMEWAIAQARKMGSFS